MDKERVKLLISETLSSFRTDRIYPLKNIHEAMDVVWEMDNAIMLTESTVSEIRKYEKYNTIFMIKNKDITIVFIVKAVHPTKGVLTKCLMNSINE